MASQLRCVHCGRSDFCSQKGLSQHQMSNQKCFLAIQSTVKKETKNASVAHAHLKLSSVLKTNFMQNPALLKQIAMLSELDQGSTKTDLTTTNPNKRPFAALQEEEELEFPQYSDNEDYDIFNSDNEEVEEVQMEQTEQANEALRQSFQAHVTNWEKKRAFTRPELSAIKLLHLLRKTTASLTMYESIMKWHFEANGSIRSNQTVGQSLEYVSRESLLKQL
jgi:hypothetical protein